MTVPVRGRSGSVAGTPATIVLVSDGFFGDGDKDKEEGVEVEDEVGGLVSAVVEAGEEDLAAVSDEEEDLEAREFALVSEDEDEDLEAVSVAPEAMTAGAETVGAATGNTLMHDAMCALTSVIGAGGAVRRGTSSCMWYM
jgi:hypothetical protein